MAVSFGGITGSGAERTVGAEVVNWDEREVGSFVRAARWVSTLSGVGAGVSAGVSAESFRGTAGRIGAFGATGTPAETTGCSFPFSGQPKHLLNI